MKLSFGSNGQAILPLIREVEKEMT